MIDLESIPLPERTVVDRHLPTGIAIYGYTNGALREWRASIASAVLEEAAKACKLHDSMVGDYWDDGVRCCIDTIRALKPKEQP